MDNIKIEINEIKGIPVYQALRYDNIGTVQSVAVSNFYTLQEIVLELWEVDIETLFN